MRVEPVKKRRVVAIARSIFFRTKRYQVVIRAANRHQFARSPYLLFFGYAGRSTVNRPASFALRSIFGTHGSMTESPIQMPAAVDGVSTNANVLARFWLCATSMQPNCGLRVEGMAAIS